VTRPKKSLGQNFLIDRNVAKKIVRTLELKRSDRVVEVGPGKGALTSFLLEELDALTAIEIDDVLSASLREKIGPNLKVIHRDVLEVDLPALAGELGGKVRIVGNIPYNITSPILFWIIDSSQHVDDCTLMMQREVAERLVAKPRTKEYGILSIFAQYYARPEFRFTVPAGAFQPPPEVVSAVISLDFRQRHSPPASDDSFFRLLVRSVFGQRRKTLRNGLRGMGIPAERLGQIPGDFNRRPEELTVSEFVALADRLASVASDLPLTLRGNRS